MAEEEKTSSALLNLNGVPSDVQYFICYFLSPKERLTRISLLNKYFHSTIVGSPKCFRDVWITIGAEADASKKPGLWKRVVQKKDKSKVSFAFDTMHGRRVILLSGEDKHPFYQNIIKKLQRLLLDDAMLGRIHKKMRSTYPWIAALKTVEFVVRNDANAVEKCTDLNKIINASNIKHLRLDCQYYEDGSIGFPKNMKHLQLEQCRGSMWSKDWWFSQAIGEGSFEYIEYLSLYQCHFGLLENQNQMSELSLFNIACPVLTVLTMRECTWKGQYDCPPQLRSLRWYKAHGCFSVKNCKELIEVYPPEISQPIFDVLRCKETLKRLVLPENLEYSAVGDHYSKSKPWSDFDDLTVIYAKALAKKLDDLEANLKKIFPNSILQCCDELPGEDWTLWGTKHKEMMQTFQ